MTIARIRPTFCIIVTLLVLVSWVAPAQANDAKPTMRAFRQLQIGMTDAEASIILKRPLRRSCSQNWQLVDIVAGKNKFSYGSTGRGRIYITQSESRIDGGLRLDLRNLFREAKKAECWFGKPEKVEKSWAVLSERRGPPISKSETWCAVWRGGEASFCLEEPMGGRGSFSGLCSQRSRLEPQTVPSQCPPEYVFCRGRFSQGGTRF